MRLIICCLVMQFSFCWTVKAKVIDRIVAIVNNDIVTWVQLQKESAPFLKKVETPDHSEAPKNGMRDQIHKRILDALIENSLIEQEAKRYHIRVSETEVNNSIKSMKESREITQQEFEMALERDGITMKEYRENIQSQILKSKLINYEVRSKVVITDSDIKNYYDANTEKYQGVKKYHLRNILMDTESGIKNIETRLKNKENFKTLVKKYSIAANAEDGGDLGLFDIRNFSENIREIIATLQKGEHSKIVATPQGYQIFYIEDMVMSDNRTLEQATREIQDILYREKVGKKFETWLESLKKKAHIKIML